MYKLLERMETHITKMTVCAVCANSVLYLCFQYPKGFLCREDEIDILYPTMKNSVIFFMNFSQPKVLSVMSAI